MLLITGGLGYLGAHMVVSLASEGHDVIIVDNLSNTNMRVLEALEQITGKYITFIRQDVRNTPAMQRIFEQYHVSAVIHMAGLNDNHQSFIEPLAYYNTNVVSLLSLLKVMNRTGIKTLLFPSTACVYANTNSTKISGSSDGNDGILETHPLDAMSPYAKSAQMCEQFLQDIVKSMGGWRIAIMRYFNVAGCHTSYKIGEHLTCMHKLMPMMALVARGNCEFLPIFGNDHKTKDGTCVRDYVHIDDVMEANMQALAYLHSDFSNDAHGNLFEIFNIGTGIGHSVLAAIECFSDINQTSIKTNISNRRLGDAASLVADITYAKKTLKWQPQKDLADICLDTWTFFERK